MDNPEEEKIPLARSGNHHTRKYESLVSRDNSLIYCCHGNDAEECCQNGGSGTSDGKLTLKLSDTHCHDETEVGVDKAARCRLLFASLLCLVFMIGEAVGGILANSLAIATDAAHLLTDFASFMISLMAIWVASRPATRRMSFGWYRAEVIGALISVLLIWVVTGVLVYMAAHRICMQEYDIDPKIMLITAAAGMVVNIIMAVSLQAGGVSHGHSHGGEKHGHQHSSGKDNINVRAAFIHVIGDFIQSFGVLVAALVIYYKEEYAIIDPICTFVFSILVLITTFAILRDTLNVLMEGMPRSMNFQEVMKLLYTIPGVVTVHNLRIWSLSMDKTALSAHIVVDNLKGKVIWITGASSGIGEYLAYELCHHKTRLILSGTSEERLNAVKEKCIEKGMVEEDVFVLPFNMTDFESHEKCFARVLEKFQKLDILVNNAGRSQRASFGEIDVKVDKELFDINVFGTLNLTRKVLPHFLENKQGHFVVTSSCVGKMGAASSASYTGSKHALHGYFETLRTEMTGKNIDVTMVCPGPIFSRFLENAFTGNPGEKFGKSTNPVDRRMPTDRCARLMAVSIAHKLDEAWIAMHPNLLFYYLVQYTPTFFRKVFIGKMYTPERAEKLREGRW